MEIYIAKNKTQMGPYNIGQVTQMIQSGILEKYDLYWHEGMLDWAPLAAITKASKPESVPPLEIKNTIDSFYQQQAPRAEPQLQYVQPNITITTSASPLPANQVNPSSESQGIVAGGYLCAFTSLLFLPPAFGIAGLMWGTE